MIHKSEHCAKCRGRKPHTPHDQRQGDRRHATRDAKSGVPLSLGMVADACVRREALELSARVGYPINPPYNRVDYTSATPSSARGTSRATSTSTWLSLSNSESASPPLSGTKKSEDLSEDEDVELTEERQLERDIALSRFPSKRTPRSFSKTVRYECRKQVADRRPRVKGRYVGKDMEDGHH